MSMYSRRVKTRIACPPGRTKQAFKKTTDVNDIIARYRKSGVLDHVSKTSPVFTDVSKFPNFQQATQLVTDAAAAFAQLSSEIRTRFSNDPTKLGYFLQDPANNAEAVKLGLISAPKAEAPPAGAAKVPPKPTVPDPTTTPAAKVGLKAPEVPPKSS